MPTDASASATAANRPSSSALKRCDVSVSSSTSSIVRMSSTGCSGSSACTARGGGLRERQRRHRRPDDDREAAPVALAACTRRRWRPGSPRARPADVADDADHRASTTVFDSSGSVTRRPIGSASPHSSLAAARLTSITSTSPSATSRPRSSGTRIALQVARRDLADRDRRLIARQQLRAAVDHDRLLRAAGERQIVDDGGGLHARQRADALQRAVEERGGLRRRLVSRLGQRHVASSARCADRSRRRRGAAPAGCGASRRRPSAARPTARPRRRSAAGASGGRRRRRSRPPSFSASLRSVRPARSAGSTPARMPVSIDAPSDEQQHAAVDRDLVGARHLVGEQRGAGREAGARQQQADRAAGRRRARAIRPAAAGTRGARPAPSAARIASSLRRPSARANSRLPTLAQAISSTSATAASSITSDVRMSPTISSCSGTTVAPQPVFSFG